MHLLQHTLALLPICITTTLADFLVGSYPPPLDLSSDESILPASWKNLTAKFDAYLKENKTAALESLSGVENVTFSVGLFSLHDPAATKLQYHHTSPEVANAANGTNQVDGDSIYRMASVTKLFTVFAGLLELTDEEWNRPLTEVFAELAEYAREHPGEQDPVYTIQWDKVTPWALANHLAGFPGGGVPGLDLLSEVAFTGDIDRLVTAFGFPPADLSKLGPGWNSTDPLSWAPEDFIKAAISLSPSFLPWASPSYTNPGMIMLGLAISNITGKSMDTIYHESIFQPLGMTSSQSTPPTSEAEVAHSVVVGDPGLWFYPGGITTPSGGFLSTINDLSKFGVSILNSTLFPAELTRKWMKPTTFTPSLSYSVGAPWEIIRYIHPSTGKVTDLYTKLGDSGPYGGCLVLVPEYNAGFSFLNGHWNATLRSPAANAILDHLTNAVLPALEAQAAAEAARNFVGTYISTDPNLNSSVTISFNESTVEGSMSGLSISSWISNGTDALAFFNGVKPRLLPSIPNQSDGPGKVAFKASTSPQSSTYAPVTELGLGPFTGLYATNGDWILGDPISSYYAGVAVNLFVFDVDGEGRATAVSPAVTRVKLERREESE